MGGAPLLLSLSLIYSPFQSFSAYSKKTEKHPLSSPSLSGGLLTKHVPCAICEIGFHATWADVNLQWWLMLRGRHPEVLDSLQCGGQA